MLLLHLCDVHLLVVVERRLYMGRENVRRLPQEPALLCCGAEEEANTLINAWYLVRGTWYTLCVGFRCVFFAHYAGRRVFAQACIKYGSKLYRPGAISDFRAIFVDNGCQTRALPIFGTPQSATYASVLTPDIDCKPIFLMATCPACCKIHQW